MRIEKDVSFKDLTTLKVGGIASTVCYPESPEELIESLEQQAGDFFILGGGSNVLASDDRYEGIVYVPSFKKININSDSSDEVLISADAGVVWDELVLYAVSKGLWGIENLSGIPGTVGGAVFQNIGAYGAALSDTIKSVRVFDTKEKSVCEFSKEECDLEYRASVFKKQAPRYVILSAQLALKKYGEANISYKDLSSEFANDPSPRITAIRTAVLGIRRRKLPSLEEYGTAGSFFLNPVVTEEEANRFRELYPDMPLVALPEGGVKVSLAWILDNIIGAKEMSEGGALVWKDQALVITTKEGATATDVSNLQKRIQEKVFNKTNIKIIPEVRIIE